MIFVLRVVHIRLENGDEKIFEFLFVPEPEPLPPGILLVYGGEDEHTAGHVAEVMN